MNYSPEDYVEFYNERIQREHAKRGCRAVAALTAIVVLFILLGCDAESAEVTSKIEQDAYERYADVQAVARYRITDNPIKASTLEVTLTVCQQYPEVNHKWQCHSVK